MGIFAQNEMVMDQAKQHRQHNQCDQRATATLFHVLTRGDIALEGLLPYSSNYTLLAVSTYHDCSVLAVYKPRRGERPLWDFPHGTLYRREVAAYLVSEELGFCFVPLTVVREGPLGIGSFQQFIDHDQEAHLFTMIQEQDYRPAIQRLVVFDYLVNNADRKSGHGLKGADGFLWAIDHGICFHHEDKLRTILWDFVGQPIPADIMEALGHFKPHLEQGTTFIQDLHRLLSSQEIQALGQRLDWLLENGVFPSPGAERHFPWPPI
jgi:uncharacterized repeat protein (TIGR03843 family)